MELLGIKYRIEWIAKKSIAAQSRLALQSYITQTYMHPSYA